MTEQAWRHPWQVVRVFRNGALIVKCSHRTEVIAGWCSGLRDLRLLSKRGDRSYHHDERRTPERAQ